MLSVTLAQFGCCCDYLVDPCLYSCAGVYNHVTCSSCCTALNFLLVEERW